MIYLVISTIIVIACVVIAVKTLGAVREERLAQQSRGMEDFGAALQPIESESMPAKPRWWSQSASTHRDTAFSQRLRAAGLDIALPWWMALVALVALGVGVIIASMSGYPIVGAVGGACVVLMSSALVSSRVRKRQELFDLQLSQTLPQLAASVQGSLTFERALRVALIHMEDPLRREFSRVLRDAAYGTPLHEALEAMAHRMQNNDVRTLAAAMRIRQASGGSVGSTLSMIAKRVNGRIRAARELRVEVASTRLAKWFVAAAMPALFLLMCVSNADFLQFYSKEPLGWMVLGVAATLEVVGLLLSQAITSTKRA